MTASARYLTADDAAVAALNLANPISIRENKEYGGLIYCNSDGSFGFTYPRVGTSTGFSLRGVELPPGTREVGIYHCHGDYSIPYPDDPRFNVRGSPYKDWLSSGSDRFGPNDYLVANSRGVGIEGYRSYLGTPGGHYLYYDVKTATQGRLPRNTPRTVGSVR